MTVANPRETHHGTPLPPPRVRRYRPKPQPAPRSRINSAVIFIVVAGLITAVGMLYLIQTNHVAGLGFEMSQLQREREALALRNEQLNYSIAQYESLGAVEEIALGEIGMSESEDFVFLSVPRPASAGLPIVESLEAHEPSVWRRIWRSLSGEATAVRTTAEDSSR
ncbi:hypothetical protein BH23CHL1_BH23CHL1_21750 [soil metagenome]